MIGGHDIVIDGAIPKDLSLDIAIRVARRYWQQAVIVDGESGTVFQQYSKIPFDRVSEFLVYMNHDALLRWEELGSDESTANTMVHLLNFSGSLTIVIDDCANEQVLGMVDSIRTFIRSAERARVIGRRAA